MALVQLTIFSCCFRYIIEPCLNFLQIADPQSAADLVVGLDITSNECQCVGLECLQCPNRTAGLANELELYGPDGVCNASVAGDWVCAADAPSADCQLATDPLRINFGCVLAMGLVVCGSETRPHQLCCAIQCDACR